MVNMFDKFTRLAEQRQQQNGSGQFTNSAVNSAVNSLAQQDAAPNAFMAGVDNFNRAFSANTNQFLGKVFDTIGWTSGAQSLQSIDAKEQAQIENDKLLYPEASQFGSDFAHAAMAAPAVAMTLGSAPLTAGSQLGSQMFKGALSSAATGYLSTPGSNDERMAAAVPAGILGGLAPTIPTLAKGAGTVAKDPHIAIDAIGKVSPALGHIAEKVAADPIGTAAALITAKILGGHLSHQ